MPLPSREPVVLIPSHPHDRPDPDVGQRVREAVKRSNTGGHPPAGRKPPPADTAAPHHDDLHAS
jgi:hypothetical protein